MPMTAVNQTFTQAKLLPLYVAHEAIELPINLIPSTTFVKGQVLEPLSASANDVQTITAPGSGTYTLTFTNPLTGLSATTAAIAYNANDAAVQSALQATVTATGGGTVAVASLAATFSGALANRPVALMTYGGTAGGSVAHTTTGATAGTYQAYASGTAKCILSYSCATDASGYITFGTAATGGYWGETHRSVPAYFTGIFDTSKLTGLNTTSAGHLGKLLSGSVSSGVLAVTGP